MLMCLAIAMLYSTLCADTDNVVGAVSWCISRAPVAHSHSAYKAVVWTGIGGLITPSVNRADSAV